MIISQTMSQEGQELVPYLDSAQGERTISAQTRKLLEDPRVLSQMALASGTPASEVPGNELTIVTILIDDSGSMAGRDEAVRKGHLRLIERLKQKAPNQRTVILATHLLNGIPEYQIPRSTLEPQAALMLSRGENPTTVVQPYRPISLPPGTRNREGLVLLDATTYTPNGSTPLIQRVIEVLGGVLVKYQEARDEWKDQVRTATLIMTDGEDSTNRKAAEVKTIVDDMRATRRHIIAAMGFGYEPSFRKVFAEMGIAPEWILTAKSTDPEIDRALSLFATAATQATREDIFGATLSGGFKALAERAGPGSGN